MTKEQLGQIILSSEKQMYATAWAILGNEQDCADAIQEAIVKSFTKYQTLRDDTYAKTWLIRILLNECYSICRKKKRVMPLENLEIATEGDDRKDYSELYAAVNALKDELRLPVLLYYMEDFSVKEVAKILRISEGAVQKRLARARKKLQQTINLEEVLA